MTQAGSSDSRPSKGRVALAALMIAAWLPTWHAASAFLPRRPITTWLVAAETGYLIVGWWLIPGVIALWLAATATGQNWHRFARALVLSMAGGLASDLWVYRGSLVPKLFHRPDRLLDMAVQLPIRSLVIFIGVLLVSWLARVIAARRRPRTLDALLPPPVAP